MILLKKDRIIEVHAYLIQETGGSLDSRKEVLLETAQQAPFMAYVKYDLFSSIKNK